MKTAPRFYVSNPETVSALQPDDINKLRSVFETAENLWYGEWQAQGGKDEGSCCLGKGIEVWFVGKGKRVATTTRVVRCNWVQGNLSASRSVKPALDYLKAQGIEASYDDGRMD